MTQSLDKKCLFTTQIPQDERLCLFRKKKNSVMENEKQVLLDCPRYESLRKESYDSINELCPNLKNFGLMIHLIIF